MKSKIVISPVSGKLECKSVGVVVFNSDSEILLLDRRKGVLGWACPAGHVEPGEEPADAFQRELVEETGIVTRAVSSWIEPILGFDANNACSRGAEAHEWRVYLLGVYKDHLELREPDKHKGIGWFSLKEIDALELEPVWCAILARLRKKHKLG